MAATITGSQQVSVIQGSTVTKANEWGALSEPTEVYFQFREALNITKADAQYRADQLSDEIETILANGAVTDVTYSQDVTPGGRLVDQFTVYWQKNGGATTGWVTIPMPDFTVAVALASVENEQYPP